MAILQDKFQEIESSHWYDYETGKPMHEVPYAGKREGMRPTTLADARKLRLCRSVTNFLSMIRKKRLEDWIIGQTIKATENNPRNDGEGDLQFQDRVRKASRQTVQAASTYGQHVHDCIATVLESGSYSMKFVQEEFKPEVVASSKPILDWLRKNDVHLDRIEHTYVNRLHGYGGTADLTFSAGKVKGIFDFKSRRTTPGKPVEPRDGQDMQLAAYASCRYWGHRLPSTMEEVATLSTGKWAVWSANLYFSTTELGRFDVVWYPPSTLALKAMAFRNLVDFVKIEDEWDPVTPDRFDSTARPKGVQVMESNASVKDLAGSLRDTLEAQKKTGTKKKTAKKAAKKKAAKKSIKKKTVNE